MAIAVSKLNKMIFDVPRHAFTFVQLGFNDYIAARHLLQNGFILQGITLASTAVEKYLKAVLVINNVPQHKMRVHLDKIEKLKKLLAENYIDFTYKFDERFLEILSKSYSIRYYDSLTEPITIGFFINQFLCELDFCVAFFEQNIFSTFSNERGENIPTKYQQYVNDRKEPLTSNNYLFHGLSKKEFMEQPDNGYCIYIDPLRWDGSILAEGKGIVNKYDGQMTLIRVNFSGDLKNIPTE